MIAPHRFTAPFNGAVEIGLRALAVLTEGHPQSMSLQRLVILDYLLVHSDDLPDGPPGLHPKTPHRSAELLVRRQVLQEGLALYRSRALVMEEFSESGVAYCATECSASFLDALASPYTRELRARAGWLQSTLGNVDDKGLNSLAKTHIGDWGAEFAMESVLWMDEPL